MRTCSRDFVLFEKPRIIISGTTRPAKSSGTPKISPRLEPLPSVRLITKPAMNRTKPMPTAKEKV